MKINKLKRNGMSVTEVVVVILITATLASLALPSFMTQMKRVKSREGVNLLQLLLEAQLSYRRDHGEFAEDLTDLYIDVPAPEYFKMPLVYDEETVAGVTVIAGIQEESDEYFLYIRSTGEIVCVGGTICNKMGY